MKRWQRLAGTLVEAAKQALDDSQPPERLRAFLTHQLARTREEALQAPNEWAYARHLAADLGLIADSIDRQAKSPPLPSRAEVDRWRQSLSEGRVLNQDGLAHGAGLMLLSILEQPGDQADFLQLELTRLLRHVEVKRHASLQPIDPTDQESAWLERHAVAILFSRAARRQGDLRFLNAALKLNDWAFPTHHRLPPERRLGWYLWSLAEQETTWKAVMG